VRFEGEAVEATMKLKAIGAAALLALLMISAQSAGAQPAQATAAAPSERKLQLARELVEATGMDATMVGAFHDMAKQMTASAGANLSQERQDKLRIVSDAEGDVLAKLVPTIVQSMVSGYAQTFTEQELSDMLAFYRSASGRSMVSKTPQFMRGITAEMAGLMPQMRREIGAEVCAKLTCTAAERAAYFGAEPANSAPSGSAPSAQPPAS
jgi:hypothetical protein